jgi:hypothetical protein
MTPTPVTTAPLADIHEAMRALKVSKQFLYRLPPGTPGRLRFGRTLRFDLALLRQWAAEQGAK